MHRVWVPPYRETGRKHPINLFRVPRIKGGALLNVFLVGVLWLLFKTNVSTIVS